MLLAEVSERLRQEGDGAAAAGERAAPRPDAVRLHPADARRRRPRKLSRRAGVVQGDRTHRPLGCTCTCAAAAAPCRRRGAPYGPAGQSCHRIRQPWPPPQREPCPAVLKLLSDIRLSRRKPCPAAPEYSPALSAITCHQTRQYQPSPKREPSSLSNGSCSV